MMLRSETEEQKSFAPFSEPGHAFFQVSTGFKFWVCHDHNRDFRQGMANQSAEMFRKATEGTIATLIVPLVP